MLLNYLPPECETVQEGDSPVAAVVEIPHDRVSHWPKLDPKVKDAMLCRTISMMRSNIRAHVILHPFELGQNLLDMQTELKAQEEQYELLLNLQNHRASFLKWWRENVR